MPAGVRLDTTPRAGSDRASARVVHERRMRRALAVVSIHPGREAVKHPACVRMQVGHCCLVRQHRAKLRPIIDKPVLRLDTQQRFELLIRQLLHAGGVAGANNDRNVIRFFVVDRPVNTFCVG